MADRRVNDGGPAYPQPREWMEQGLTVRDVFAAHAIAGLVCTAIPSMIAPDMLASKAYDIAAAMIARRARDYATAAAASLEVDRPLEFDDAGR